MIVKTENHSSLQGLNLPRFMFSFQLFYDVTPYTESIRNYMTRDFQISPL